MSELHALIRRSVIDRGLISAADREEVYRQARAAVLRELWSYEPPLPEAEIDARMGQFDRAIDALEGELSDALAASAEMAQPAPSAQPTAGAVSIFEGYDRDTDYVPAYSALPARQPSDQRALVRRGREGSQAVAPASRRRDQGLDPLALRSAAIEAALRSSGDDDLVYEPDRQIELDPDSDEAGFGEADPFADTAASDHRDRPSRWSWGDDEAPAGSDGEVEDYPAERDFEDRDDDDGAGLPASSRYEESEVAPETAGKRPRTALLADRLRNLNEPARIRILIGAIAGLGLVLVVLAGFMLSSLLSSPDGARQAAAASGSGGGATATAAATPADAVQTVTVFDGSDPTVFESSSGNPVRFDKAAGFARISSSASDPGVRVVLAQGLSGRFAGRPVRVTVLARAARENGAAGLRFAYENGIAISQWQTANLGNDFAPYNLVWRVPALHVDPDADQLLIEPGIPGDGTAADIRSIKIDVLK